MSTASLRLAETHPALTALTGDYDIDPAHTRIGFAARHAMVATVRGQFGSFTGWAHLDGDAPERSTAELTIDVATLGTGQAQRDEHLRGGDFFDVERWPTITFRSTAVEVVDEETFRMSGDLTVRDVTRPVTVEFVYQGSAVDPFGNARVGFEGRTTINRKDWGLTWNVALETGGILVGDKIKLEFDVSAVRRAG